MGFMHSSHAVPPAEGQGSRTAVTHGSKATAEERSVTAFSSAPVEEEMRGKKGRDRRKKVTAESGKQNAVGALEENVR